MWSATPHRGGKMTKSAMATPGRVDLAVSTVKIDGSYRKIIYRGKNVTFEGVLMGWRN